MPPVLKPRGLPHAEALRRRRWAGAARGSRGARAGGQAPEGAGGGPRGHCRPAASRGAAQARAAQDRRGGGSRGPEEARGVGRRCVHVPLRRRWRRRRPEDWGRGDSRRRVARVEGRWRWALPRRSPSALCQCSRSVQGHRRGWARRQRRRQEMAHGRGLAPSKCRRLTEGQPDKFGRTEGRGRATEQGRLGSHEGSASEEGKGRPPPVRVRRRRRC